jgi:hypothetical protein
MADGFVVGNRGPWGGQHARFVVDGTGGATGRAGLLRVQGGGLLRQGSGEGSFGQASGSGQGDLLHGVEVHIQAGALVAEGAAGDDFTPTLGEGADLLEQLRGELATRHGLSCLVLAEKGAYEVLQPL